MSDDQVAFLRARLDEDEDYARTMIRVGEQKADEASPRDMADALSLAVTMLDHPEMKRLLARHQDGYRPPNDLYRVLREVEAKRAIIAQWEAGPPDSPVLTFALCNLTAVYRDHPDYDPAWKP